MTPVAIRTVAVVALLVLAGCSSGFGGDDLDREPYGVDEPVEQSAADNESLLPGLTTTALVDGDELVRAHYETLSDRSYTIDTEVVVTDGNGSTYYAVEQRERIDRESVRLHLDREENGTHPGDRESGTELGGKRTIELWLEETRLLQRIESENGTVSYDDRSRPDVRGGESRTRDLFESVDRTNVTSTTVDGEDYYVIDGEGTDPDGDVLADESFSVRIYVREDGLIRHYRLEGTTIEDGEERRVVEEATVDGIGETTVERPAWYEEAVDATDDREDGENDLPSEGDDTDEDDVADDDQSDSASNSSASIGRNVPISVTIPIA